MPYQYTCAHCSNTFSRPYKGATYCSHKCARAARFFVPQEQRFWAKVDTSGECWLWTGATTRGYGVFDRMRANRFSWILHNGPIPDGLYVLHSCDQPLCVRPAHLRLGTQADNMRDKVQRGRQERGEAHHAAKFTEHDIRAIRASTAPLKVIAQQYRSRASNIWSIRTGKAWKHVT